MKEVGLRPSFGGAGGGKCGNAKTFAPLRLHKNSSIHKTILNNYWQLLVFCLYKLLKSKARQV